MSSCKGQRSTTLTTTCHLQQEVVVEALPLVAMPPTYQRHYSVPVGTEFVLALIG